jgi:exopolysaccharide biosynthesis protein
MLTARLPALNTGTELTLSLGTAPDLKGAPTALGGGPLLLHDGQQQSSFDHKSFQRHPRSALGWNAKYYFLVAVDGRQRGLSVGMTLEELADYMSKLGCDEAMNLDGGASVELWIGGRIVNSPCFGRERHMGGSLVLLQTTKAESR